MDNMERLPNEVLMMILERVPAWDLMHGAARVCRRWAALAERRALALRRPQDLQRLRAGLVSLHVTLQSDAPPLFLATIANTCPHLRDLTVDAVNSFTHEDLLKLEGLPRLSHLDVFTRSRMLDHSVAPVLLRLTSLVINETVFPCLLRILSKSQRLRALYMYGCALYYPPRELRTLLRARRHYLRELTLRCIELPDSTYATIAKCEFLTSLQLYSCWLMTIKGAMNIVKLKFLKCLHITGARMLREKALVNVIECLPLLIEELVLSATWFTAGHVPSLITRLPRLRVFEAWRCSLTAESIMMLANGLPGLETLDTDINMPNKNIHTLETHPSLTYFRCNLEDQMGLKIVKTNGEPLQVWSVHAKYNKYYIRSGDGYHGSLFYFWSRHRHMNPMPDRSMCVDSEEDCS